MYSGRAEGPCPAIDEAVTVIVPDLFSPPGVTLPPTSPNQVSPEDTDENELKVWDEDANQFFDVGGQGSNVHVGADAPDAYELGDLWFNTTDTELTLYVYDGSVWVPAALPVSLDGIDSWISYLEPLVESQQWCCGPTAWRNG